MNTILLLILFGLTLPFTSVVGDTPDIQPTLLPISNRPPIHISEENKEKFQNGAEVLKAEAKRNVELFEKRKRPLYYLYGLVVTTILSYILYRVLKKLQEKAQKMAQLTTQQKALRDLSHLTVPQEDVSQFENYYIQLTDIVRSYIEEQFLLKAKNHTTEEFLSVASRNLAFDENTKELLKDFLHHADLVKFAELQPSPADLKKAYDSAERFISGS